jgi:hypothetical protein
VVQEQVVSSLALMHETRNVDDDHSREFKFVRDKPAIEHKYIVDYLSYR